MSRITSAAPCLWPLAITHALEEEVDIASSAYTFGSIVNTPRCKSSRSPQCETGSWPSYRHGCRLNNTTTLVATIANVISGIRVITSSIVNQPRTTSKTRHHSCDHVSVDSMISKRLRDSLKRPMNTNPDHASS